MYRRGTNMLLCSVELRSLRKPWKGMGGWRVFGGCVRKGGVRINPTVVACINACFQEERKEGYEKKKKK